MKVSIPLPTITATWVQVPVSDGDETSYIASWDLKAGEVPESLNRVMGFSGRCDSDSLIAWIDQVNPKTGRSGFYIKCPGMHGDADTPQWDKCFSTLEEAQAAVHKALGAVTEVSK